jgi:hypothetical protein
LVRRQRRSLIESVREAPQRFGEFLMIPTLIKPVHGRYALVFGLREEIHDLQPPLQVSRSGLSKIILPVLGFLSPDVHSRARRDDIRGERHYV